MFIKKENNKIVTAPKIKEVGNYIYCGYNSPSNREQLLADGYIEYNGHNPLDYLDIVDGEVVELQYPPVNEIRESLHNQLYEMKSEIAYTGVNVTINDIIYLFDTDMDSITMINSVVVSANDDQRIDWKAYVDNVATSVNISIVNLKKVFYFGMQMINSAFGVESKYNNLITKMSDEDIVNDELTSELINNAISEFDNINKNFSLN